MHSKDNLLPLYIQHLNNRQRQFDFTLHKNYVSIAFQVEGNKVMLPVIAGGCNGFGLISLKEFSAPHFGQWRIYIPHC